MNRQPEVRLFLEDDEIVIDGFAGGGGASTGIEMALGRSPDIAINHDPEALAMHSTNHPTTEHYPSNIHDIAWTRVCRGRPVAFGWFSPDCTYFSKALGGKPHRDRKKARRRRGLAGVIVKCAVQVRPRVLFMENVEEFEKWCPLDDDGLPDVERIGQSFRRWVARLRNLGYIVEWRVLKGSDFGAPTSRKRLYVVARCDGQSIVWPRASHGPRTAKPFRTAAECIDFGLPVPSIFLSPEEAKAWAREHGLPTPKRPLAMPTLRRIARGMFKFVIDSPDPFIISVRHHGDGHVYRADEPLRTIPASDREFALVAPVLVNNSELRGDRVWNADEPVRTLTAAGCRTFQLVTAFLAKHNGGHEATGQRMLEPTHTITTVDQKALVTSHLLKMYGTCRDGAEVELPMPTITAHGNHLAEVRAFLVKYYGNERDGQPLQMPLGTVVTKDRFALVTVMIAGQPYVIADIGMRMLTPRELYLAQGFPRDYIIDATAATEFRPAGPLTKKAQTRLVGNSVVPQVAAALVSANLARAEEAVA